MATAFYGRRVGDRVLCGRPECGDEIGTVEGGLFKLRLGYDRPRPPEDFCRFLDRARGRKLGDRAGAVAFPRRHIPEHVGDGRLWPPLPARVKCLRCGHVEVIEAERIGVQPTAHRWAPMPVERSGGNRGRIVNP